MAELSSEVVQTVSAQPGDAELGFKHRSISPKCLLCTFPSLLPEGHRNDQGLTPGDHRQAGKKKNEESKMVPEVMPAKACKVLSLFEELYDR